MYGIQTSRQLKSSSKLNKHQRQVGLSYQDQDSSNQNLFHLLPILFCFIFTTILYVGHYRQGTSNELQQIQNITDLIIQQKTPPNYQPKDFYWFSVSTRDLIINSNLDSLYRRNRKVYSVDRTIHLRALLLTQLTHNIDSNGNIKVEMSPFDYDKAAKQDAIKRIMKMEEEFYDTRYNIKRYEKYQLRFCIIVPSYNNVKQKLYLRNLDSIFMQDYQNYHIVYIDDHSTDKTGEFVLNYLVERQINPSKIKLIINQVNKKAMQNIYQKIHEECPNGEIVALIDGDDSFNGRQVLKLYNALFHQKKAALIYSNFLKITSNSRTQFGFGSQITKEYFEAGYLRSYWPIVGTHLMSFYSDIFKMIRKEDFQYENGTFYDYAYDRAIITPLLQMSHPRNYYLPEMVYEYRNDTGVNDGGFDWKRVSNIIQERPGYKNLQSFSFIDTHFIIRVAEAQIQKQSNSID